MAFVIEKKKKSQNNRTVTILVDDDDDDDREEKAKGYRAKGCQVIYGLIRVPYNHKTRTRTVAHALHNKTKAADIVRSVEVKGNYFQLNIIAYARMPSTWTIVVVILKWKFQLIRRLGEYVSCKPFVIR